MLINDKDNANLMIADWSRVEGREGIVDGAEMEEEGDEGVDHYHEKDCDCALKGSELESYIFVTTGQI